MPADLIRDVVEFPLSYVLRGGSVVDGTGQPARTADVVVADGRIEAVLESPGAANGYSVIDVEGLVVAPGFIDLHTHCDFTLPRFPRAESMVRQGVTTLVVGNCGHSVFPVGSGERETLLRQYSAFLAKSLEWTWTDVEGYVETLEELPLAPNVALLVGHGAVRVAVMGFDARPPSGIELDDMRAQVARAMRAGAFGLSTGLIYSPGSYAATDEIAALAQVAHDHGGIYTTHMRNEGPALLQAIEEALSIGRETGIPVHLSHHKVLGRRNWGLTERSLRLIDDARARGLDVTADQYPYTASSTTLAALLPPWSLQGGMDATRARLRDPERHCEIRREVLEGPADGRPKRDFEPDTVVIASIQNPARAGLIGRSLADLAAEAGSEPVDLMLDLLDQEGGGVEVVIFAIGEADVRRVIAHPQVAVASDGWTLSPAEGGTPHPRSYGTFVRVLGHYVRDEAALRLEEAVRKMTSLPAQRLRMSDRGVLRASARADIAVFDPSRVAETATFTKPHQYCEGVESVFIGGRPAILTGEDTGLKTGRVLRRPATTRKGVS